MKAAIKSYATLPLWIGLYLVVAYYIGEMTRHEIPGWYRNLAKHSLNPPDFVFPIMWTTLYITIAIAGWRIWKSRSRSAMQVPLILFAVQTLMNWAWSYLFFDFHWLAISFAWLLGLVACVACLVFRLYKPDRITALILIPYLCWISFASYLNGMIWYLN